MPSDGDPVVSVGVSKVCTKILVSIGYGAIIIGLLEVPAYLCCSKKKVLLPAYVCMCMFVAFVRGANDTAWIDCLTINTMG